jgi:L-malate glycosyltransferase
MQEPHLNIFVPHCSDLLTDHLPHGDGLIAHGFMTSLARRGHRLHVAAENVNLREPLHRNITLHPISLGTTGKISPRLEYMFRIRNLLRRLQTNCRFDLIHQLNPVFTGISLSLVGSGLPLVLGTYVARWPDERHSPSLAAQCVGSAAAIARRIISDIQQRNADALILTTPAAFNRLPRPAALRERVHMLPHGLDTDLFSPAADWDSVSRLAAEQQNRSILFLANVLERKGIFTLVDAFSMVVREIPSAILRIAGDGPQLSEVKRRVSNLNCAGNVEFLGRQERNQAPSLYRSCAVYCLPSYGEPYATTVLEAMGCARALVVTDAGGLRHMVDARGGKRVPVGDAVSLGNALIGLLRNPAERRSMGLFNRQVVEKTMSWDAVAQQLEEIYMKTLERFPNNRAAGWHGQKSRPTCMVSEPRLPDSCISVNASADSRGYLGAPTYSSEKLTGGFIERPRL